MHSTLAMQLLRPTATHSVWLGLCASISEDTGKRRTGRDLGELVQLCHLLDFSSELQACISPSTERDRTHLSALRRREIGSNSKTMRLTGGWLVLYLKSGWVYWQRAANYLKNLWEGRVVSICRVVIEWPAVRKCQLRMGLEMSLY